MKLDVKKAKLPKGLSYLFKTSDLEQALDVLASDVVVHLKYLNNTGEERIFDALYWLPNQNVNHRRIYITTQAIEILDKEKFATMFQADILPEFAKWVAYMNSLADNSTELKHNRHFRVGIKDKKLTIDTE